MVRKSQATREKLRAWCKKEGAVAVAGKAKTGDGPGAGDAVGGVADEEGRWVQDHSGVL